MYHDMGTNLDQDYNDSLEALRVELASLQGHMSLHHLVTIMTIHLSPGMSVNELADTTAVPQQTASRTIATLMGRYQTESDQITAAPLVEQRVSATNPRSRAVYLTHEGQELIERFAKVLRLCKTTHLSECG